MFTNSKICWSRSIEGFSHETKPHLEDKYLVFISQLLLLFKFCRRPDCKSPIVNLVRKVSGTCLTIKTECLEGHEDIWESQPRFGLTAWGNYLLAASIFFAGEIPSKFLKVFKNLNIRVFSTRMYFKFQRMFHPIIEKVLYFVINFIFVAFLTNITFLSSGLENKRDCCSLMPLNYLSC